MRNCYGNRNERKNIFRSSVSLHFDGEIEDKRERLSAEILRVCDLDQTRMEPEEIIKHSLRMKVNSQVWMGTAMQKLIIKTLARPST